ncbi:hypothetical protein F5I97DRAFT_1925721 [Phlebopus sp. FC_14]|nr:hypothetical protein F5I97DRAFT_1925721 [Phlebopus sp. FC_14]
MAASSNHWGYPEPGPQSPSVDVGVGSHFFADNEKWNGIIESGQFDDIVCGSGHCALAYIDTALRRDPKRKILVLERGPYWIPEHFQNLPLAFGSVVGGPSETFPWHLSSKTYNSSVRFLHGSCPYFGGRSTMWSAWSPQPTSDLMRGFPKSMLDTAAKPTFWSNCKDLLHVTQADELIVPVYKNLQKLIDTSLAAGVKQITGADTTEPASLAVGHKTSLSTLTFEKFSTVGPLLEIYNKQSDLASQGTGSPLTIATNVVVHKFDVDPEDVNKRAYVLHTSCGSLDLPNGDSNIILALGTVPNTTLLLNSIPDDMKGRAGSRITGHFVSHITARFPVPSGTQLSDHLEIGANYIAGKDATTNLQYHIQVSAFHSPNPATDAGDALRFCPDYAAAPSPEQLEGSENYIVLVCATLGELEENNPNSLITPLDDPDLTTNIRLQILPSDNDLKLQTLMDQATYDAVKVMAGSQPIQYWNSALAKPGWQTAQPPASAIHPPGIVHEASTLHMSDDLSGDAKAAVGPDYKPKGCGNVYVTGGALFPSAGSWNPTLTMCGYAQDLAAKLVTVKNGGKA